jgi:peptide/nickel transport system permease protein
VSLLFYSMPDFWLALIMMLVFGLWLRWFPTGGMADPMLFGAPWWTRAADQLHRLVLPATTLTLLTAAAIARHQRSAALEVLGQDYVRTARAKGASERRVWTRHVLRNALLPVITLVGLAFPAVVGGAVLVETVFSWPGMGLTVTSGIFARDYHLITASVIVGSVMVALGSLLADLLYLLVDPRLRSG